MTNRRVVFFKSENPEIQLSDTEDQLCSLLVEFTRILPQAVECCIAGGWVRDKSKNLSCTRVTKVESRADQSKHLETAKLGVLGLDLDFVNLRSEEYTSGSRIPAKVEFGTKLEDTLRRDITINALLYNVHTRSVEDHTKKGIPDLRAGIIRTPLSPKRTFLDDPLRVLRCIRFASRFSFKLVPELVEAARDEEVQRALDSKITRERIGEEIYKMIKGPDPLRAVQLIHALSLYRSIFTPPSSFVPSENPFNHQTGLAAVWKTVTPHSSLLQHTRSSASIQGRLFLASALTPFKDSFYTQKNKQKPLIEACLRDGLKLGVQDHLLDGIPVLFKGAKLISDFELKKLDGLPGERAALGLLLRQQYIHSPIFDAHWTSTILFSLVQELAPLWKPNNDRDLLDPLNVGFIENEIHAFNIIQRYNALIIKAEELDLIKTLDMPHLLNGHDLTSLLGRRPGPWVGDVLSKVMEWQLKNPGGNKAECESWIKLVITEEDLSENRKAKKAKV
ncbi:hypothetical protein Clacol_008186 [Clathrus columnatus]|uniref:Poly A polymerase head domain-containing protein n=1 Tax=Clathrus columnatus TaxID=1419009 RepID=A0AAV5AMI2_9AGAM|nr:hypothetical protein Clacol_008186 [Clathrus columnatus]